MTWLADALCAQVGGDAWYPEHGWLRLRPPPTGNGDWGTGAQAVKDRWVYALRPDPKRTAVIAVDDPGALRHWHANATPTELAWATRNPQLAALT